MVKVSVTVRGLAPVPGSPASVALTRMSMVPKKPAGGVPVMVAPVTTPAAVGGEGEAQPSRSADPSANVAV